MHNTSEYKLKELAYTQSKEYFKAIKIYPVFDPIYGWQIIHTYEDTYKYKHVAFEDLSLTIDDKPQHNGNALYLCEQGFLNLLVYMNKFDVWLEYKKKTADMRLQFFIELYTKLKVKKY